MPGDTYSFVIRIWADSVDEAGNPVNWRGYIDLVGGDQRLYFQKLESIPHFIKYQTKLPDNRPRRWWNWVRAWIRK